jgi:hypothetical protein
MLVLLLSLAVHCLMAKACEQEEVHCCKLQEAERMS